MHEKQLDAFVDIARKVLPSTPVVYVEIGARDCVETVTFDELMPGSKIFAFECNPDTLPACRKKVEGKKNIRLIEKAVTEKEGVINFFKINNEKTVTNHPHGTNPGASSIFEASGKYEVEKYVQDKISVTSTTLEKFSREFQVDHTDLLWMDIQGAELSALRGAGDFIDNISLIHTEVEFFSIYKDQPLFREVYDFLAKKGFHLYTFTSMGKYAGDAVFINRRLGKRSYCQAMSFITFTRSRKKSPESSESSAKN